ncbi:precorrin-2 C(20)-methyltransferase, partial [Chamaesiphon polymorphus CCALA 037]
ATAKEQRIVSIEDVDSHNVPYFSLIVVPSKTQL